MLSPSVTRWSGLASEEAQGMPVGCLLRLVDRESGGQAGIVAGKSSGSGKAAGLTQVTPIALQTYNLAHPGAVVPYQRLLGTDEESARLQLRVGAWVWMQGFKRFSGYTTTDTDRAALADLSYAQGPGRLGKLIADAKAAGAPITLAGLRDFAPDWGAPEHPFAHAAYVSQGTGEIVPPVITPETGTIAVIVAAAIVALVALAILAVGLLR